MDLEHQIREMGAGISDLFQVFGVRVAEMARFRDDHIQVAQVLNLVAQFRQAFVQIRVPIRGGRRDHARRAAASGPRLTALARTARFPP